MLDSLPLSCYCLGWFRLVVDVLDCIWLLNWLAGCLIVWLVRLVGVHELMLVVMLVFVNCLCVWLVYCLTVWCRCSIVWLLCIV